MKTYTTVELLEKLEAEGVHDALFIVQGVAGSGKTTFAKKLARALGIPRIHEADDWFNRSGEYVFKPEELGKAHRMCQLNTEASLMLGGSAIVSNTFTSKKEFTPYFDMAADFDVPVVVIRMDNEYGNVHGVPEEALERQRARIANCAVKPDYIVCD